MNGQLPIRDPVVLRSDYKTVLRIADDFLSGRIGILAVSRAMCRVKFFIDAHEDPDFKRFTEIADCSWHLPIGSDREFYAYTGTDEELQAAIAELERKYAAVARSAAQNLVRKYSALIEPSAPPNGDPATRPGNSEASGGPPSVS
jgi:hypothetical protein